MNYSREQTQRFIKRNKMAAVDMKWTRVKTIPFILHELVKALSQTQVHNVIEYLANSLVLASNNPI